MGKLLSVVGLFLLIIVLLSNNVFSASCGTVQPYLSSRSPLTWENWQKEGSRLTQRCVNNFPYKNLATPDSECFNDVSSSKDGSCSKEEWGSCVEHNTCYYGYCQAKNNDCHYDGTSVRSVCGAPGGEFAGICLPLDGQDKNTCIQNTGQSGKTSFAWIKEHDNFRTALGFEPQCCGDGFRDTWSGQAHYYDIDRTAKNALECGVVDESKYPIVRYDSTPRCVKGNQILNQGLTSVCYSDCNCNSCSSSSDRDCDSSCRPQYRVPCTAAGGTVTTINSCIGIENANGFGTFITLQNVPEELCGYSSSDYKILDLIGCYDSSSSQYLPSVLRNACIEQGNDWVSDGACFIDNEINFAYNKDVCLRQENAQWRTKVCAIETDEGYLYSDLSLKYCGQTNSENIFKSNVGECWRPTYDFGTCVPGEGWMTGGDANPDSCKNIVEQLYGAGKYNPVTTYIEGVGCCGNNVDDFGSVVNEWVCTKIYDGSPEWHEVYNKIGVVYPVQVESINPVTGDVKQGANGNDFNDLNFAVVSNGEEWIRCADFSFNDESARTLGPGEFISIELSGESHGFLCADNSRVSGVAENLDIQVNEEEGTRFVECGYNGQHLNQPNVNVLHNNLINPGNYELAGGKVVFCTGSSNSLTLFTNNLDNFTRGEQTSACNNLASPYNDRDKNLDAGFATGSNCCGEGFIQGSFDSSAKFEYFSDSTGQIKTACWNNKAIHDGEVLFSQNSGDKNVITSLLRGSTFDDVKVESGVVNSSNWKFSPSFNGPLRTVIVGSGSGLNIEFAYNSVDTTVMSGNVKSHYATHLTKNMNYELIIKHSGENVKFYVDIEGDSGDVISGGFISTGTLNTDKMSFIANSDYYNITISFEGYSQEEMTISEISLLPNPAILNNDGKLYVCDDKYGKNSLSGLRDTLTGELLFNSPTPHCSVAVGDYRCSPEGYWILRNGTLVGDQSGDYYPMEFDGISVSPNIIEGSDISSSDNIFSNSLNCVFKFSDEGEGYITEDDGLIYGYGYNAVSLGEKYASCSLSEISNLEISDSNGKPLDSGYYIFSAWINGQGTIYLGNSKKEFSSEGFERVSVLGEIDNDGVARIGFQGTFDIDNVQLEKASANQFEAGEYFSTVQRRECCNPDYECWNGRECKDMSISFLGSEKLDNPDFKTNDGESGYACFGGSYSFVTKKYRWDSPSTEDEEPVHGFCAPNSCFVGTLCSEETPFCNLPTVSGGIADLSVTGINRTSCVQNGEDYFGYKCESGRWKDNSEFMVSYMYDLANDNLPYVLYCGDYRTVLPHYEYMELTDGSFDLRVVNMLDELINNNDNQIPEVSMVTKACVLISDGGGHFSVGLSLHADMSADQGGQVLNYFNEPTSSCSGKGKEGFEKCGTFLNPSDIYYNSERDILIYTKELRPRGQVTALSQIPVFNNIQTILQNLFSQRLESDSDIGEFDFLKYGLISEEIRNFNEIFIFESAENHMFAIRDKIIIPRTSGYTYISEMNTNDFGLNLDFLSSYNIEVSRFNNENSFEDTLMIPSGTGNKSFIYRNEDGNIVVSTISGTRDDSLFYNLWPTYTGRLRGEVTLDYQK